MGAYRDPSRTGDAAVVDARKTTMTSTEGEILRTVLDQWSPPSRPTTRIASRRISPTTRSSRACTGLTPTRRAQILDASGGRLRSGALTLVPLPDQLLHRAREGRLEVDQL
ncbi:MAG: hypothetical protein ACRDSH_10465, partial [Pseudonocardiaceae bacterium]